MIRCRVLKLMFWLMVKLFSVLIWFVKLVCFELCSVLIMMFCGVLVGKLGKLLFCCLSWMEMNFL